jgi:hypothetical protein
MIYFFAGDELTGDEFTAGTSSPGINSPGTNSPQGPVHRGRTHRGRNHRGRVHPKSAKAILKSEVSRFGGLYIVEMMIFDCSGVLISTVHDS